MSKVKKVEKKFAKMFVSKELEQSESFAFLNEYLNLVEDKRASSIFINMIAGVSLSEEDNEYLEALKSVIDFDVLFVDYNIKGSKLDFSELNIVIDITNKIKEVSDLGSLISKVMDAGRGLLKGWDEQFIFGSSGSDLLNQYVSRGRLSDKQKTQLIRIAKKVGVYE